MKNIKRFAVIMLSILLLVSVFVGCKSGTDASSPTPISPTPVTSDTNNTPNEETYQSGKLPVTDTQVSFSFWWPMTSTNITNFDESLSCQEMEKRTNVNIDWVHPSTSDADANFALTIASEDLPDFMWIYRRSYPKGNASAVADGVFLRLNDLIDKYAPTYKDIMTNWGTEYYKNTRLDDGTVYAFYHINKDAEPTWKGMAVRKDLLDKYGLGTPATIADWEVAMTAMRDDPESGLKAPLVTSFSPFLSSKVGFANDSVTSAYGVALTYYQEDGKVKFGPIEDGYLDYLTLMKNWYDKGLLYKEFASYSPDSELIYTTQFGFMGVRWPFTLDNSYKSGRVEDPNLFLQAIRSPVLSSDKPVEFRYAESAIRGEAVITSSCTENLDVAVKWFDYQYTQDAQLLNNYGIEGVSYEFNDKGEPRYTKQMIEEFKEDANILIKYNRGGGQDGPGLTDWKVTAVIPPETTYEAAMSSYIWMEDGTANILPSGMTLTPDESSDYSAIMGDVNIYVEEMSAKMIMGLAPLSDFDAFVAQLKSMGIEETIAIKQASYDRYQTR